MSSYLLKVSFYIAPYPYTAIGDSVNLIHAYGHGNVIAEKGTF